MEQNNLDESFLKKYQAISIAAIVIFLLLAAGLIILYIICMRLDKEKMFLEIGFKNLIERNEDFQNALSESREETQKNLNDHLDKSQKLRDNLSQNDEEIKRLKFDNENLEKDKNDLDGIVKEFENEITDLRKQNLDLYRDNSGFLKKVLEDEKNHRSRASYSGSAKLSDAVLDLEKRYNKLNIENRHLDNKIKELLDELRGLKNPSEQMRKNDSNMTLSKVVLHPDPNNKRESA